MNPKPNFRGNFVAPVVTGLLCLSGALGWLIFLYAKQIAHYRSNYAEIAETWAREEMRPGALDATIDHFTRIKLAASSMLVLRILMFIAGMGTAVATDRWVLKGWDVSQVLEAACILLISVRRNLLAYYKYIISDLACTLVTVSVFSILFWYMRSKLSWREQLYYASYLTFPLIAISITFFSDYGFVTRARCTVLIEEYIGMDASLRRRIVDVVGKYGLGADSVFISENMGTQILVSVRFNYMIINSRMLKMLNGDQMIAVVYHEMGHVMKNHVVKIITIFLASAFAFLAVAVFVYRKVAAHCNGLAAWVLSDALLLAATEMFLYLFFLNVIWQNEVEADLDAYSQPGYREAFIESQRICALCHNGGRAFDYEDWASRIYTHPSNYKRISAARAYSKSG